MNTMRTNSIISDPEPFVPALSGVTKPKKVEQDDYAKIANSKSYPQFTQYINGRIDHFKKFTPDGRSIAGLSKKERIDQWDSAVVIITELESLLATLKAYKK